MVCHLREYLSNIYVKQLLNNANKNALKTASKNVVHKAPEGQDEFIEIKIADKIVKPKPAIAENSRNVEEIFIPLEKGQKTLNEFIHSDKCYKMKNEMTYLN